jgi:hypothetical protein
VLATANDAALRLKPTDINGESLELLKRGDIAAFRKGGNGKWMPSPERPRLSRSALGERFNALIGTPPVQFLIRMPMS